MAADQEKHADPSGSIHAAEPSRPDAAETSMTPSVLSDASPVSARAAGLGDRFRYFRGRSGRRYLFSAMDADALDDLAGAVLLVASDPVHGEPRPTWIGEIDENGLRHGRATGGAPAPRTRSWVHLLAGSAEARRAVLSDLGWSRRPDEEAA